MPEFEQCSNNQTYCIDDNNYPSNRIEELMKKYEHKYLDVFGRDEVDPNIASRANIPGEEEITMCDVSERVIFPQAAKRMDGSATYIVNTPKYKQGIRISECLRPDKPCNYPEEFSNGRRTMCRQQFFYRELLSVGPDEKPIKDKFPFPSCCSCAIYKIL